MMRIAMSSSAGALLRALVARDPDARDRILLTDVRSTDWQSLTFTGERHRITLSVVGADSERIAERLCAGLGDAEFTIPGLLVADIAIAGNSRRPTDGAVELVVDALTISED